MSHQSSHTGLDALGTSRRRGEACLSNLVLDRLLLGELGPAYVDAAHEHMATCAACRDAFAALRDDDHWFRARPDFGASVAHLIARFEGGGGEASAPPRTQVPRRKSWWWWPTLVPAAAFAALLLLVGGPARGPRVPERSSATRSKGGFSLSTYVFFRDRAQPGTLHMGEPLAPGDRIQFRVSSDSPGFVAIIAVDAAAQVSVYYPPGPRAEAIAAGRDLPLSTAVELDDTPGREVIIGLRCETALPVADIVTAARAAVANARAKGRPTSEPGPLGLPCAETRTSIEKSGASPRPRDP